MNRSPLIRCFALALVMVHLNPVFAQSHAGKTLTTIIPEPLTTNNESPYCGADCLFVLLCYFGKCPSTYRELVSKLGSAPFEGYSLLELREAAITYGAHAECVTLDFESIAELPSDVKPMLFVKGVRLISAVSHTKEA